MLRLPRLFLLALAVAALLAPRVTAETIETAGTTVTDPKTPPPPPFPGSTAPVAGNSVFRLQCVDADRLGTAFLHKSGKLISAAHVVKDCKTLSVFLPSGEPLPATTIAIDQDLDLALIEPSSPIAMAALPIETDTRRPLFAGMQVSTWGFPAGYTGIRPMLSVGHLSSVQAEKAASGRIVARWVVNAAFNSGNSGGPLILAETGNVFGVVASKAAPISQDTLQILDALAKQKTGFTYEQTQPDGTKTTVTEGYLIGKVLNELRLQVQLVIGLAVTGRDLVGFLEANKIEP